MERIFKIKYIFTLLFSFAFMGCSRNMIPIKSESIDSIRIVKEKEYIEIFRDSIIYVEIPIEVKEVTVFQDSSFLETSFAESIALINNDGSLYHSLNNKQQSKPIDIQIKDTQEKEIEIKEVIKIEYKEIPVKLPLSKFKKFLLWSGIVAWIFLLCYIGIRIFVRV